MKDRKMKTPTIRIFAPLKILCILCLTFTLGTVSASGYDNEKRSEKHKQEKNHKHKNKHKNKQILITQVNVDFAGGEIHIYGQNLDGHHHGSTVVLLAGDELATSSISENQISAYLKPGTVAGDYLLTVRSGKHGKYQDNYALTIGGIGGGFGEKGEPGRDGATGPAGAIGLTGAIGATGPAGPEGATGPAGAQGLTGPAGPAGAAGTSGSKGDKGAAGAKGATGSVGLTGATGSQGIPGAKGDKGLAGVTGPAGSQGANGPAGATGPTGPEGPQGLPGAAGYELLQQTETTLNNQGEEKLTPTCPVGKVAISGGIMETNNPITVLNSKEFNIAAMHPDGVSNWRARWFNGTGTAVTVVLYTICING